MRNRKERFRADVMETAVILAARAAACTMSCALFRRSPRPRRAAARMVASKDGALCIARTQRTASPAHARADGRGAKRGDLRK
jgi:hypothetical protein